MPKTTRRQKVRNSHPVSERKYFDNLTINPRNDAQEEALESLRTKTLTIMSGPPGTAKTLLSVYVALEFLEMRQIDKIYYVKPIVEIPSEVGLGAFPGELEEKIVPFFAPVKDALSVFCPPSKASYMFDKKIIEFLPLEHLRGRSLNNCFIIADEMQNTTPKCVLTILTRLGSNARVALLGDVVQRDMGSRFGKDGLTDAITRLKNLSEVQLIEFEFEDVCRSSFVKSVIYKYSDLYTSV